MLLKLVQVTALSGNLFHRHERYPVTFRAQMTTEAIIGLRLVNPPRNIVRIKWYNRVNNTTARNRAMGTC